MSEEKVNKKQEEVEIKDEVQAEEAETDQEVVEEELDPLVKLEQEQTALNEKYLRLAAEFDNYKKRTQREYARLIQSANEDLILQLLEIIDNFNRALENKKDKPDSKKYHQGVMLIYDKLINILKSEGLEKFDSLGEKFDPNFHEALMQVESEDYDTDFIAQVFEEGYKLNDKVLRHAKVGVTANKEK